MALGSASHQKPGYPGRLNDSKGEARAVVGRDEARPAGRGQEGSGRQDWLWLALSRENMVKAWKRVKANKGSAGVDGLTIEQTVEHLKTHWPRIRSELVNGTYQPRAVRRVEIPKPMGGIRTLGIPTVTDRLIQQALLQVLQPMIDPTFSEFSYGFRPGRSAHDAVLQAQRYAQDGYRIVVDVDLESFFDRVNHDILMERLARRIPDKAVLRLIRLFLQAGERVLRSLRKIYARLHLRVNEKKTAVGSVFGRKFLGYCLRRWSGDTVKLAVAPEALDAFKQRIRAITRRCSGRAMTRIAEQMRVYLPGWKAYFRLAQTPRTFKDMDSWIRHRLRALHLKHWHRATTTYRRVRSLGANDELARQAAGGTRHWWHHSAAGLNRILTVQYFDDLGFPRLT